MKIPVNKILKLDTRKLPELIFMPIKKKAIKKVVNEQNAYKALESLSLIHI